MRNGPREKLFRRGVATLSDAELLSVLLGTGSPGQPVGMLAQRVLLHAGGVRGLRRQGSRTLIKLHGLGETKTSRLLAALELGQRALAPEPRADPIRGSDDVYEMFSQRLRHAPTERFFLLALDARNRPIAEHEVARGGRVACQVDTAEVFRLLLADSASGVVFVHNHPSGDPTPSTDDVGLTRALVAAAQLLQIRVLDHVIVGGQNHYSFEDKGLLLTISKGCRPP